MLETLNAGFQTAYIADIVVILYLLIMAIFSAKKGFVGCVFGLIGSIVALAVAFLCAETVMTATGGTFGLQSLIEGELLKVLPEGETVAEVMSGVGLPEFLSELIPLDIPEGVSVATHISQTLGNFLTLVVTGVVLYIVCKIVLKILEKLFRALIERISFINAIDKMLGALIGIAQGALTVLLILAVITMIPEAAATVGGMLDQTLFLGSIYNANPILQIFSQIFAG